MRRFTFLKGHATLNDFVIIEDQHGMQALEPAFVRELCDRRGGIGADGVLRVVRAQHIDGWRGDPDLWFMDYWNSDGTMAETCGNGLRLFARHLMNEQLVPTGRFSVATRAGVKDVRMARGGMISVDVGEPKLSPDAVTITHGDRSWPGAAVDVGNPHAVVFVDREELERLDLSREPTWSPEETFPHGVNVEFVHEADPGHLVMRVHERGSGETMSCGTGVVASAAVHRHGHAGSLETVVVRVPGGELQVDFEGERVWLTGPAVINMRGEYWA